MTRVLLKTAFRIPLLFAIGVAVWSPALPLRGQTGPPPTSAEQNQGSIRGTVTRTSGLPVVGVGIIVSVISSPSRSDAPSGNSPRTFSAVTDVAGRYSVSGLPWGRYYVNVRGPEEVPGGKTVTLNGLEPQRRVNFVVPASGAISGRVLDKNKEPVTGAMVFLIAEEYDHGALRYSLIRKATTDDRGQYVLRPVRPGRPYFVHTGGWPSSLPAVSDVSTDRKARRQAVVPTYYPNSTGVAGAVPISLADGELREYVDIEMRYSESYCVEGNVKTGSAEKGLYFEIRDLATSIGTGGKLGPGGRIRICGLAPGSYRLLGRGEVALPEGGALLGGQIFTVVDEDVRGIEIALNRGVAVPGRVVWEDSGPGKPGDITRLPIALFPVGHLPVGEILDLSASVPGDFVFPSVLIDDYVVEPLARGAGVYIKDMTYGGRSVLHEPLRVGSGVGNAELRIVLARDGASLAIKVVDDDGKPVPGAYAIAVPDGAVSEGAIASRMRSLQTQDDGSCTFTPLAPGKYLLTAATEGIQPNRESIAKLLRTRSRAKEVNLAPSSSMAITLAVTALQ